ncbi:hypothetical protein NH8B_1462 [Pseudogulbenkiania sp. NH8B]|nr:hypothetical protein NH8B_1462 [Pseudogulbenkiania sp. NH8B]
MAVFLKASAVIINGGIITKIATGRCQEVLTIVKPDAYAAGPAEDLSPDVLAYGVIVRPALPV